MSRSDIPSGLYKAIMDLKKNFSSLRLTELERKHSLKIIKEFDRLVGKK